MTIAFDPASITITVPHKPTVKTPTVQVVPFPGGSSTLALFEGTNIKARGSVKLTGAAGDNPAGWTLGFIQVEWIETNWAYYIGQHKNDGSILLQMGKPPARPAQGCRDTDEPQTNIFYENSIPGVNGVAAAGATLPLTLNATFYDKPSNSVFVVEPNSLTGKSNFLSEAQLEFHFCTVLALRDPAGKFHQLASFYWNMHWQATFQLTNYAAPLNPASWAIYPNKSGTSSNTSPVYKGKVTDPKFHNLVTALSVPVCNTVAANAANRVGTPSTPGHNTGRYEKRTIEMFDVGR